MLRWCATDSEARPDVSLSIEHTNVVQIAFLEGRTLCLTAGFTHIFIIEPEAAMYDQVSSDQDGTVPLARTRRGAGRLRFGPSHDLKIQYKDIVEEFRTVPTAKDDHLRAAD